MFEFAVCPIRLVVSDDIHPSCARGEPIAIHTEITGFSPIRCGIQDPAYTNLRWTLGLTHCQQSNQRHGRSWATTLKYIRYGRNSLVGKTRMTKLPNTRPMRSTDHGTEAGA